MFGFTAEGFRDLDRQLERLERTMNEDRLRAALRRGAQPIVDEAKRLVRVDTGRLRDSIMAVDDRDGRLYGKLNGGDGVSVYVGPVGSDEDGDVYYARFQEFGTVIMRANPFMRPAIAAKRPEAEALVQAILTQAAMEVLR